jgi:hypothetical protein
MAHQSFGGPLQGGTTVALLAAAMSGGAVAGGVFSGPLPRVRRQGLQVVIAIMVWGMAMVGTSAAVAGGGAAVVVTVVISALAVPAFTRYRAPRTCLRG